MVERQLLEDAEEALGNFVSEHGWGDSDMAALDNLSAVLAAAPRPPAEQAVNQQLTTEMVLAAARVLNDRHAEACDVDKDDQWKIYSDDYKEDARAMLTAAHGIKEADHGQQT